MKTFSDRNSVKQYVDDRMPADISCYGMSYDDLVEYGTDNLIEYLRENGVFYGDYAQDLLEDLDSCDNRKWWELFE